MSSHLQVRCTLFACLRLLLLRNQIENNGGELFYYLNLVEFLFLFIFHMCYVLTINNKHVGIVKPVLRTPLISLDSFYLLRSNLQ
jgi:hypothetical protein